MDGPQRRSGRRGEEEIFDPTGTRTPTPRSSSPYPVAIPTALSRCPYVHVALAAATLSESTHINLYCVSDAAVVYVAFFFQLSLL
jgi:hypothetical protein